MVWCDVVLVRCVWCCCERAGGGRGRRGRSAAVTVTVTRLTDRLLERVDLETKDCDDALRLRHKNLLQYLVKLADSRLLYTILRFMCMS